MVQFIHCMFKEEEKQKHFGWGMLYLKKQKQ